MTALALFAGVLLVGVFVNRVVASLVMRAGLIDVPNERSSHTRATPRGGGIGILAVLVPGAAAGLLALGGPGPSGWVPVALAAALVAVAGFVDDRRGLRAELKLLVQIAAGGLVVLGAGAVRAVELPFGATAWLSALAVPLTVLWVVAFTNAMNFMDGTDGLAASFGGVAASAFAALGLAGEAGGVLWLAVPLSAASLSFLSVNWNPARVFMGDVGSLTLGLLLACLAVVSARAGVPFVSTLLVLSPFLVDTLFTLCRRACRRENLLRAHRSHLYQRLTATGWSHARVAVVYGAWSLLSAGLAFLYRDGSSAMRASAMGAAVGAGAAMVGLTMWRERARADGNLA